MELKINFRIKIKKTPYLMPWEAERLTETSSNHRGSGEERKDEFMGHLADGPSESPYNSPWHVGNSSQVPCSPQCCGSGRPLSAHTTETCSLGMGVDGNGTSQQVAAWRREDD